MALKTLEEAKKAWLSLESTQYLKPELEIYFAISMGQVYEESNFLQIAVRYYMKAKSIELYYNHPDKAIPYSTLG